jgi:branched-chain amino acid transport system substrate-binding protein
MKFVGVAALTAIGLCAMPITIAHAQFSDNMVKIGVLTDMSGFVSQETGQGSVVAANMAAEKFGGRLGNVPIEIVSADHQNKPDVGAAIARKWLETDGVDVIVDLANSTVALAVSEVGRQLNKPILATSAGSSALTGRACSPMTIQWTFDTYSLAKAMAKPIVEMGKKSWFFIAADNAFGASLQQDAAKLVKEVGGEVVGVVKNPPGTNDFSSYLLQAQASKANVIALATAGGDTGNAIKQSKEFRIQESGQMLAGLSITEAQIHAIGLDSAQGLLLAAPFYWDLNDGTRDFSLPFAKRNADRMPSMMQAGVYSALLHYLKAAERANTDDGKAVMAEMKAMPTDDPLFGKGSIRADGRKLHQTYLYEVKAPGESTKPWDYYKLRASVAAADAVRPLSEGGCPLVN